MHVSRRCSMLSTLIALLLCCFPAAVRATVPLGYVQYSESNFTDSTGALVANAQVCFSPVNNAGNPIGYQVNGHGHASWAPVCANVTNGAFTILLADTALTAPANVCFRKTATDNVSGKALLGPGYSCMQPEGSGTAVTGTQAYCTAASGSVGGTCNGDLYVPNMAALVVTQTGPTGLTGPQGATAITGMSGDGAGNATLAGAFHASTVAAGNSVSAPMLGAIYVADAQTGSGCAQKINAAIIASGGNGTIQIGAGCGYLINAPVNPSGLPVAIQFVSIGAWIQSAPIIIGNAGSLSGPPISEGSAPVTLIAANNYAGQCPADPAGVSYYAQICMAPGSTLHDLGINGNKSNQSNSVQGVLIQNANAVNIYQMLIGYASQDDIHTTSTFYPAVTASEVLSLNTIVFIYSYPNGLPQLYKVTTAGTGTASYPGYPANNCTAVLGSTCTWGGVTFTNVGATYDNASGNGLLGPHVLLNFAGRDGLFTERTFDWLVAPLVEFEQNTRDGFHCEDCGAWRFSDDDWGANGRYAYYAAVVNGQCNVQAPTENHFILGSQFGGNVGSDIYINGSAASAIGFCATPSPFSWAGNFTIVGNQFIGSASSTSNTNSVVFIDAGGNDVIGNTWGGSLYGAKYNYLATSAFSALTGSTRSPNQFSKNAFTPQAVGSVYQTATPYSLTAGVDVADAVMPQGAETEWGDRIVNGHVAASSFKTNTGVAGSTAATFTLGDTTTAGTGASVACTTGSICDQFSGDVTLITGTSPSTGGTVLTVNMATRANAPNCTISVFNMTNYTSFEETQIPSTSTLTFINGNVLTASTTYRFTYVCGGV